MKPVNWFVPSNLFIGLRLVENSIQIIIKTVSCATSVFSLARYKPILEIPMPGNLILAYFLD